MLNIVKIKKGNKYSIIAQMFESFVQKEEKLFQFSNKKCN